MMKLKKKKNTIMINLQKQEYARKLTSMQYFQMFLYNDMNLLLDNKEVFICCNFIIIHKSSIIVL